MDNHSTRRRVDEIYDTIERLKRELNGLRYECSHDSYTVANYSHGGLGGFQLARVCIYCGEYVGEPNEEEVGKLSKNNQ